MSAKKIQDQFEVINEDINQVNEFKINILVHKYELFKIESSESITNIFTRFTNIINGLKSGKDYTNRGLVRKIIIEELGGQGDYNFRGKRSQQTSFRRAHRVTYDS